MKEEKHILKESEISIVASPPSAWRRAGLGIKTSAETTEDGDRKKIALEEVTGLLNNTIRSQTLHFWEPNAFCSNQMEWRFCFMDMQVP